jgi:hypothetical protein
MRNNPEMLKKLRDHAVVLPIPAKSFWFYQIFFLANDQTKDVEVLETEEMDFTEIVQRLKMGESVFITYKNSETYPQGYTNN